MESNITLRQGLEKFRNEYKYRLSHNKDGASNESKAFFKSHDAAHVVFGCDITLYGEGCVKIWSIFGTTLGFWKHIRGYQEANAFKLSKDFTFLHIIKNIFKFLIAIPKIVIRAKQMSKPWNWADFEQYLEIPIFKIREEFNIKTLN